MDTHTDDFPIKVADPTADWHLPDREMEPESPGNSPWQRGVAWIFFVTGLVSFFVTRQTMKFEATYVIATAESLFLIVLSQAILTYLYRRLSNFVEVGRGMRRLRSKTPEDADLPVEIEIVRHGAVTGKDIGFMWLADGTWYFKGLQTAFRLNQHDVVPIEAWSRAIKPDPAHDKPPRTFPLKSSFGPYSVNINVINRYEDLERRKHAKRFYREMFDWLTERPRGSIESLLPPTRLHPSLARHGLARVEGVAAAGLLIFFDSAVMSGLPRQPVTTGLGGFGLVAAITVGVLMASAVRLAWLEYRDVSVRASVQKSGHS